MKEKPIIFQPTDKSVLWPMFWSEFWQRRLNKTATWNIPKRNWIFKKIVSELDGKPFFVCTPIRLQQGNNLHIGKDFYCGPNFTCIDHVGVWIGDNVMISPNVLITDTSHPKIAAQRKVRPFPHTCEPWGRGEIEIDMPVRIGNNVWIAAGSIICPGVTIGDNAVIGAGSIVTKDIPPNVLAFGSPCHVIREITEEDRIPDEYFKGIW